MALQQAAKTVQAHSRVQTEHNEDKLCASKGIIAALMKLCFFLCRYLTVMNQFVHVFPLLYERFIFKRKHKTVNPVSSFSLCACAVWVHTHTHTHMK